jgi:hypothetical protein
LPGNGEPVHKPGHSPLFWQNFSAASGERR